MKSSAVGIAAIPSPAYLRCAMLSASAVSSPLCHSQCGSLYPSSPRCPRTSLGHSQMLLHNQLLPAPQSPPSLLFASINYHPKDRISLYITLNTVCQYKKPQQLQLFKMRRNLDKTTSHLVETAVDSLLQRCELLPPGKTYLVPK